MWVYRDKGGGRATTLAARTRLRRSCLCGLTSCACSAKPPRCQREAATRKEACASPSTACPSQGTSATIQGAHCGAHTARKRARDAE
jgi:hypothetical protein